MEILHGSGLAASSTRTGKRSGVSRRPRANPDTMFQSYFGLPSFVEPYGKHDENENQRDIVVASDGSGVQHKLKKLKLKFGGVIHTIHTKARMEISSTSSSYVTNSSSSSDDPKPQFASIVSGVTAEMKKLKKKSGEVNEVLSGFDASIIDISDDFITTLSQRKKGKLSEMEQKLKKAEAAQRRKMQSEKAAREAEAEAIRKILGHDSGRKKKDEKMKKKLEESAQEKSSNSYLGSNTVRWTIGPSGTVVTFSEDIGLPSIFQMVPKSYPPPREKCAGPNCTNEYKYRDSKSKLPLCSLNCYRAIHEKMQPLIAC